MRPELEEIRIIEAYLEGKLSTEDRAKLEAKMEEDPDFRKKVEVQRDLMEGIWNAGLIAEINKAHTEFVRAEQNGGGSSGGGMGLWGWVLGLALVALVGGVLFFTLRSGEPSETSFIPHDFRIEFPGIESPVEEAEEEEEDVVAATNFRLPGGFRIPFKTFRFDAEKGTDFVYEPSGTRIQIPPDILLDASGKPVKGEVEVRYREFRDAAEMAFAEIPMHWGGGETPLTRFNSAGMFELRGFQNGKRLKVDPAKGRIQVDFVATEKLEDLKFWALNEANGQWKELRDIVFDDPFAVADSSEADVAEMAEDGFLVEKIPGERADQGRRPKNTGPSLPEFLPADTLYGYLNKAFDKLGEKGKVDAQVDLGPYGDPNEIRVISGASPQFDRIAMDGLRYFGGWTGLFFKGPLTSKVRMEVEYSPKKGVSVQMNRNVPRFLAENADVIDLSEWPEDMKIKWNEPFLTTIDSLRRSAMRKEQVQNQRGAMLLAENADAGHTYPTLVKGLMVDGFGVFNCDQVFVLGKPTYAKPRFADASGKPLENLHVLSVIDLDFNAAFSHDPARGFQFNEYNPTYALLFTKDGRLFAAKPAAVKGLTKVRLEAQELKMTELTGKVKSTEGLRKYLGLESPS